MIIRKNKPNKHPAPASRRRFLLRLHPDDARVHCVVLKIRAAPHTTTRTQRPSRHEAQQVTNTPTHPSRRTNEKGNARSLRTQQRAPHGHPTHPLPNPGLNPGRTKNPCDNYVHVKCSTHERHHQITSDEMTVHVNPTSLHVNMYS